MADNHLIGTITIGEEIYGHLQNATLQGLSAYEVAVANGFTGTEAEWLASLKGETGETPDIQVGPVQTGRPGTNASATMVGTKENPILNITIPRGDVGATPNMTIGTVTTGEEGTQAQATITGTPEDPVLNLTIPKGDTGDAGFDPVVEVTKDGNTATVSVTDATHTTEVNIVDGYTPQKNVDYFDGHSPKITGAKSQGTTFIYSDGEQIGAIADGQDGYTPRKGVDYFDGHTPAISGEKIDDTTFIYADGVRIATVLDGIDGRTPAITAVRNNKTVSILADGSVIATVSDGQDGHSPEITTTKSGKTLTILSDGTAIGTVSDGADGVAPIITTNKSGTTTTIYSNGSPIGSIEDGSKGDAGVTPEITATKTGKTTTIFADGTAIGFIEDGNDGNSPTITATKSGTVTTIFSNDVAIATVNDGVKGDKGDSPVKGTDYWTQADQTAIVNDVLASQEISDIEQDVSDVKETLNNKYEKPSTGIPASDLASGVIPDVSGKADKVQNATSGNFASLDANGNLTDSGKKASDFVTPTDYATLSSGGVVKQAPTYGVDLRSDGTMELLYASTEEIKTGTIPRRRAIITNNQHESTFYGLAKAAGDTTQASSSNAVGIYTETAQSKIHEMLDAPVTVSGTTPTITGKAGIRYICGEVSTLSITPPASGDMEVIFESGSTATVLTVPNTVKFPTWFDPTDLEANCTYDIIVTNGTLGVVTSWAV